MIRLILLAAILGLVPGCGPATVESKTPPAKPNQSASKKTPPNRPTPQPAPKVEFSSVAEAFETLAKAAAESDSARLLAAETWLAAHSSESAETVAAAFVDEQAPVPTRIAAYRVLRHWSASESKQPLLAGLDSESQQIQLNAIKGLGLIKPSDQEIIQTLVQLLDSPDQRLQRESLIALGNIGPPAKDLAAAKLIAILNDPQENETLRDVAKRALKQVNPRHSFVD